MPLDGFSLTSIPERARWLSWWVTDRVERTGESRSRVSLESDVPVLVVGRLEGTDYLRTTAMLTSNVSKRPTSWKYSCMYISVARAARMPPRSMIDS